MSSFSQIGRPQLLAPGTLSQTMTLKKANRSRNTLKVFLCVCVTDQDTWTNSHLVLFELKEVRCIVSFSPGPLRSFKRRGYFEVRRQKSRFFVANKNRIRTQISVDTLRYIPHFYIPLSFALNLPHYVTSYMHHTGKKES